MVRPHPSKQEYFALAVENWSTPRLYSPETVRGRFGIQKILEELEIEGSPKR